MRNFGMRKVGTLVLALAILAGCSKSPEERAKNHFERGQQLVQSGDEVRARLEFRNALQFNPNMVEAWRALGLLEDKSKNWPGLFAAAKRISELDAKDATSRLQLARLSFVSRKFDDALKYATEAVEIDPKNTSALALRGAVLLRLQDNRAAIQEANKVLALDPANTEAIIVLASEKLSRGDAKGALSDLKDLSPAGQNELSSIMLRIRIAEFQKDNSGIETELKKLVEIYPDEPGFKRELIRFYVANKRQDEAERLVRSLAAADPENTNAGLDVVRLVASLRGIDAAREELRTRIANSKETGAYQVALAELEYSQGRFDEAKSILDGVIKNSANKDNLATARLKLAEMHVARREYDAALALTDQVLAQDARNVAALRLRASVKVELGQLEGAINDARTALNDQPRSADLLTILALAYERGGQIELADKQLADAMRFSNFAPSYGLNYVTFLNRRGLQGHAENVLNELATRNPNNINVLTSLAQVKLSRQDWTAARELSDRIKNLAQGAGTAAEIQAAAFAGQNKLQEGIALLQEVHEANPNAVRPVLSIVRSYLQAKQPAKAEDFLNGLIKANPSNAEAYVMLGLTSLAQNKPDEAIVRFQKAIDVQPKSPIGYRSLSDEYLRRGKSDDALKVIDAALVQMPNDFGLRQAKASLLERKGDVDGAIALYGELLKEQPGSMILANNFASLISDHRSDKESLDRAHAAALALNKSDVPQFKDTLGWLYYLRGDYKNAQSLLEEAVKQLPNVALVRFHLGMTYKALGDKERAVEQLKRAAELEPEGGLLKKRIAAALNELNKGSG